jgi:hypothetical protein
LATGWLTRELLQQEHTGRAADVESGLGGGRSANAWS